MTERSFTLYVLLIVLIVVMAVFGMFRQSAFPHASGVAQVGKFTHRISVP